MKNQWDYYVYIKRLKKRSFKHYIIYLTPKARGCTLKGEFFENSLGKGEVGITNRSRFPTYFNLL